MLQNKVLVRACAEVIPSKALNCPVWTKALARTKRWLGTLIDSKFNVAGCSQLQAAGFG